MLFAVFAFLYLWLTDFSRSASLMGNKRISDDDYEIEVNESYIHSDVLELEDSTGQSICELIASFANIYNNEPIKEMKKKSNPSETSQPDYFEKCEEVLNYVETISNSTLIFFSTLLKEAKAIKHVFEGFKHLILEDE